MNRKFFNLLLMGALAVTAIGSVSSCKDYDDDINNLQDQINKVALQTSVDELKAQLANVKSTAESAQADATSALAKALGAQTAADNAQDAADNAQDAADKAQTDATAAQTAADAALNSAIAALPAEQGEAVKKALEELQETTTKNAADVDAKIKAAADAAKAAAEAAAAAQSTADAANTAAGNAQNAADNAQNAADNAQSTADEAKADAATAQAAAEAAAKAAEDAKEHADSLINAKIAALDETLAGLDNKEQVLSVISRLAKIEEDYTTAAKLQAALSDLESKIGAAATQTDIAGLKSSVAAYKGSIDALFTAVTGVDIIGMWSGSSTFSANNEVKITCGKVLADYTFGKADACGETGCGSDAEKHTYSATPTQGYTKGNAFSYSDGELLIRVNPTNLKLTTDMIKFIDSKGNDLGEVIEVVKVEQFDELLTRGTNNTGLWKVTMKSKKNFEDMGKAVAKDSKSILYAIGVNNTKAQATNDNDALNRYVVSPYDVTFKATEYQYSSLSLDNVTVLGRKISETANRGGDGTSTGSALVCVSNGQEFGVSFAANDVNKFQYFYVVRDDAHATNSDELRAWESYEYADVLGKVTPVNHGDSLVMKVTIPSKYTTGDEVQFRLFAIDYTGSVLKDKAFRVYVGADKTTEDIAGDLKATGYQKMETAMLPLTKALSSKISGSGATWPKKVPVKNAATGATAVELVVAYYDKADATTEVTDPTKAKFVKFTLDKSTETSSTTSATDIQNLADGEVATGTIECKDANGIVVNTINVKLTKVMPTAEDVDARYTAYKVSWKAEQRDENGVHTAYLYPNQSYTTVNWETATTGNNWRSAASYGYKKLGDAFNNLPNDKHAKLKIANAAEKDATDGKKYYNGDLEVPGNEGWILKVPTAPLNNTKLIDNKTEHTATFGYDFGAISSVKTNGAFATSYYKEATSSNYKFQIIFANPLNENVQTYAFAQRNISTDAKNPKYVDVTVLKYGEAVPVNLADGYALANNKYGSKDSEADYNIATYLKATNKHNPDLFNGQFVKTGVGTEPCLRYSRYLDGQFDKTTATAKLISNKTKDEDYFTVEVDRFGYITFTPVANASIPANDVASTLVLTLKDCFGDTHVYNFDFTVKKPE